jgi:hypothetical protein
MEDRNGIPGTDVGSGSALLHRDSVPLADGEVRDSGAIRTINASTLGIDIAGDQDCTVTVIRLPDGETAGERSVAGVVTAGQPRFLQYSSLLCPAVLVEVTNTSGVAMTAFTMYVRGGA